MPGAATGGNLTTGMNNTDTTNTGTNRGGRGRNRNQNKLQRSNEISQLKRHITRLVRRLSISPSEANDLITASGSALNIPIDLLVRILLENIGVGVPDSSSFAGGTGRCVSKRWKLNDLEECMHLSSTTCAYMY